MTAARTVETTDGTGETTAAIASDFGCDSARPRKIGRAAAVGKSSTTNADPAGGLATPFAIEA
jgi:hypothetical protein